MNHAATLRRSEYFAIRAMNNASVAEGHPVFLSRAFRVLAVNSHSVLRGFALRIRQAIVSTVGPLERRLTDMVIANLDSKVDRLSIAASRLERGPHFLALRLAKTGQELSPEFIEHLGRLSKRNCSMIALCRQNVEILREMNRTSRLAAAFERVEAVATRIEFAVAELRQLALEAHECRPALEEVRRLEASIDARLNAYQQDEEFSEEMMRMAEIALSPKAR